VVFARASLDVNDTNFTNGPDAVVTSSNEANLYFVGVVQLLEANVYHRKIFSLAAAYGGVLPRASKLVFKNETGVALNDGSVRISEVWGVSATV
jgi:hypothetical protein